MVKILIYSLIPTSPNFYNGQSKAQLIEWHTCPPLYIYYKASFSTMYSVHKLAKNDGMMNSKLIGHMQMAS